MIFSVFQENWVFSCSWSTLLWYRCYYPHRSRDSLSPVCGIFMLKLVLLNKYNFKKRCMFNNLIFFCCCMEILQLIRDSLHRESMDFLSLSKALHSCQNTLSEKKHWTFLWCQEVLLSPKDKLSRVVANYPLIMV